MALGKYLFAGGLGFVLGGPIGAVVGVVLASLLPNVQELRPASQKASVQGDFRIVLLMLFANVMKADGEVKKIGVKRRKTLFGRNIWRTRRFGSLAIAKRNFKTKL